jgi:hypothetical protein
MNQITILTVPVVAAVLVGFPISAPAAESVNQAIVQIGGRFCEYHRADVDAALRRHSSVSDVECLNNHGTVLIRYRADDVQPATLAQSIEQALAMGIGCTVWVDEAGNDLTVHRAGFILRSVSGSVRNAEGNLILRHSGLSVSERVGLSE